MHKKADIKSSIIFEQICDCMEHRIQSLAQCLHRTVALNTHVINTFQQHCISAINNKGKILVFGNGGSFAQAEHFCAELTVRLRSTNNRPGLPALVPMSDGSSITAYSNDFAFVSLFERGIQTFFVDGDIVLFLTTSGRSENIISAARYCYKNNIPHYCMMGDFESELRDNTDGSIIIQSSDTPEIQEAQLFLLHNIADEIDAHFLES